MGIGSWGSPIRTYVAISSINRRGGGGGREDGDDEIRTIFIFLGFVFVVLALVAVAVVICEDEYYRETTYSLNTFSCAANNFSSVQKCTVQSHQRLWVWQEESELDTSKMGIPYVHRHKHHMVHHVDCLEGDLEDVCDFNIEKITDLGKWKKEE